MYNKIPTFQPYQFVGLDTLDSLMYYQIPWGSQKISGRDALETPLTTFALLFLMHHDLQTFRLLPGVTRCRDRNHYLLNFTYYFCNVLFNVMTNLL